MVDIDWQSVLPVGSFICVSIGLGAVIGGFAVHKIGKEIARRRDEQAEEAMAAMPDRVPIELIRDYQGS